MKSSIQTPLFSGFGEIPEVITLDNYFRAVEDNNKLFHALRGELKQAHLYFVAETDNFTQPDNLFKTKDIERAWTKHLKEVNKIAATLDKNARSAYTPYYSEGKNYDATKGLPVSELAKLIRKELSISYDDWKFSVTSDHNSINVKILAIPFNPFTAEFIAKMKDDEFVFHSFRNISSGNSGYYNEEYKKQLKKIEGIVYQYNFNDSDSQSDYFHRRYYDFVSTDETTIMHKYFPKNKSILESIERAAEWERKTAEINKKAAERKGKYPKGKPVLYEYTGKQFPQKKYPAKVLKSPNGHGRFTGYDLSVTIDARMVNGEEKKYDKPLKVTFNDVPEAKIFPVENEDPLLKQKFKVGDKVYFDLEVPVFDTWKSKEKPILLPGTYEVEIQNKTRGEYPTYSFRIPYIYFNEHHQKEYPDTKWFSVQGNMLRKEKEAAAKYKYAKAKALALELELQMLGLKGLSGYKQKNILSVQDNYKDLSILQLKKISRDNYNRLIGMQIRNKHLDIAISFNSTGRAEAVYSIKRNFNSIIATGIEHLKYLMENAKFNNFKDSDPKKRSHQKKRISGFLNFTGRLIIEGQLTEFRLPVAYKKSGNKFHYHITETELKKVLISRA